MAKKRIPRNFEASLSELETLVEKLEGGELSLEESLQTFSRGVELTRACQQALAEAEQKVEILLEKNDQATIRTFADDDNAPPKDHE
ncbi:MAG TPA: exodeoxyribonuclease VII small subunit [Gammaproteobacteria bacterium]|nr:exodeoxyribonuclease VII small subunit [Gammaproteobacteria bacterium]